MTITATLTNKFQSHEISVSTESNIKSITIPSKSDGFGSSVNGGELLFLALATCYCNDLYREAAKRKLLIEAVNVTVRGQFGKEGEPASNIHYSVNITAPSLTEIEINELIIEVDRLAEVHDTLRQGIPVTLQS
jgi:organic hydroperoxide reductase OsmC/OhrA